MVLLFLLLFPRLAVLRLLMLGISESAKLSLVELPLFGVISVAVQIEVVAFRCNRRGVVVDIVVLSLLVLLLRHRCNFNHTFTRGCNYLPLGFRILRQLLSRRTLLRLAEVEEQAEAGECETRESGTCDDQ